MYKIMLGIILGFILRCACVAWVDYRYVNRKLECLKNNQPVFQCNKWEDAPMWEKIVTFQPNTTCWTAKGTDMEWVYCQ